MRTPYRPRRSSSLVLGLALGPALALTALAAAPARAAAPGPPPLQAPGAETLVELRSGAQYVGLLEEEVQGSHVRLRLVTGERVRIRWSHVARIARVSAPPPPPVLPPPPPPPPEPELVSVRLQADHPEAALVFGTDENQRTLCGEQHACMLPPGALVRVGGRGIAESARFEIPAVPQLTVNARVATLPRLRAGIGLTVVGPILITLSAAYLIQTAPLTPEGRAFAGIACAAGIGSLAGGIVLLALGTKTRVTTAPPAPGVRLSGLGVAPGIGGAPWAATAQLRF